MSVAVNVHEAKTQLSRLLDQALAGEDVISCVQAVRVNDFETLL
jgi:antitoxin (DNA-binding transcriptional repressor) of toxin-antitoxin stability system